MFKNLFKKNANKDCCNIEIKEVSLDKDECCSNNIGEVKSEKSTCCSTNEKKITL